MRGMGERAGGRKWERRAKRSLLAHTISSYASLTSTETKIFGAAGFRSPYLRHAKSALYQVSYSPLNHSK